MADHTTISLKKSFLEQPEIQEWMEKQGFDSVSEASRSAIRMQAFYQGDTSQKLLTKILEIADLDEEDFEKIVKEIVEEK